LDFVVDELVDEGNDVVSLDCDQDERGAGRAVSGRVGASHRTGVNEVLAVVLSYRILMSMAVDQDVTIQLSLDSSEGLEITPRSHLMSMDKSDLEVSNGHDFAFRKAGQLIEISLHDVSLTLGGGQVLKPLHGLHNDQICRIS